MIYHIFSEEKILIYINSFSKEDKRIFSNALMNSAYPYKVLYLGYAEFISALENILLSSLLKEFM